MGLFLEIRCLSVFKSILQLHGRTGYEDKEGNVRHLAGAYRELDFFYTIIFSMLFIYSPVKFIHFLPEF